MKKLFTGFILVIFIIAAGAIAVTFLFSNEVTDRFNPLVSKRDIYVKINEDGEPQSPGGYDYSLIGYDESGKESEVDFYAGKELRQDAYLRIFTKGKYVETWEEVQFDEIPEKAKDKL